MPDFAVTKRLLDQINTAISQYDPVLKEYARDILLKSMFEGEDQKNHNSDNQGKGAPEGSGSSTKTRALSLRDLAETWANRTAQDRALLGLYYLRNALGLRSATGHQISKELKENGMGVINISVAMHENVRLLRAESRVISGNMGTRQARNAYAITDFGIHYVESRFNLDGAGSR